MSASEILEELPKLSSDELQVVFRRLLELQVDEIEGEDDAFTEACARESFRTTDEMEAVDEENSNRYTS